MAYCIHSKSVAKPSRQSTKPGRQLDSWNLTTSNKKYWLYWFPSPQHASISACWHLHINDRQNVTNEQLKTTTTLKYVYHLYAPMPIVIVSSGLSINCDGRVSDVVNKTTGAQEEWQTRLSVRLKWTFNYHFIQPAANCVLKSKVKDAILPRG